MAGKVLNSEKAVVILDQAVVSGAALLTQLMVAKGLGLEGYGRFSAIALVQLFILSLFQAGVSGIYMVVCPGLKEPLRKVYTAGILAGMLPVSLAVCTVAIALSPLYVQAYGAYGYTMVVVGIVMALLQDMCRRIFLSNGRHHVALIADLLNNGGQLAGLTILLFSGNASLHGAISICALSFVPALVYAFLKLRVRPSLSDMRFAYKHHIAQGPWLVGSALLQWFAGNIYVVAAGWWLGATALGILRLGQYVFGLFNVLLQAAENYLLPRVAALAGDPQQAIIYLKAVQRKMMLYVGCGLLLAALAARYILEWCNVPEAGEVLTVIYGMSAVYIFVVAGYPVRIALRTLQHSNEFFKGYVINAVFGTCTAYLFIHKWGIAGVMTGLFVSQFILLAYWASVFQKKYRALWR